MGFDGKTPGEMSFNNLALARESLEVYEGKDALAGRFDSNSSKLLPKDQMMILPKRPHSWAISLSEAREIQSRLAELVSLESDRALDEINLVAGIDNGYVKHESGFVAYAAAVVFTFPDLDPVETVFGQAPVTFPYVPGFLTFREGPAILDALAKMETVPDVLLFDGQGYAHPRRIGLATHMGVVLDHPSIGCAKSRLIGRYEEPADEVGAFGPLVDRGEVVGAGVRTKPGHPPLFVSPGHRIDVDDAVVLTLACCRDVSHLPIPTREAHNAVTEYTAPLRRRQRKLSTRQEAQACSTSEVQ
jgi:deoxyribonuclease V